MPLRRPHSLLTKYGTLSVHIRRAIDIIQRRLLPRRALPGLKIPDLISWSTGVEEFYLDFGGHPINLRLSLFFFTDFLAIFLLRLMLIFQIFKHFAVRSALDVEFYQRRQMLFSRENEFQSLISFANFRQYQRRQRINCHNIVQISWQITI